MSKKLDEEAILEFHLVVNVNFGAESGIVTSNSLVLARLEELGLRSSPTAGGGLSVKPGDDSDPSSLALRIDFDHLAVVIDVETSADLDPLVYSQVNGCSLVY